MAYICTRLPGSGPLLRQNDCAMADFRKEQTFGVTHRLLDAESDSINAVLRVRMAATGFRNNAGPGDKLLHLHLELESQRHLGQNHGSRQMASSCSAAYPSRCRHCSHSISRSSHKAIPQRGHSVVAHHLRVSRPDYLHIPIHLSVYILATQRFIHPTCRFLDNQPCRQCGDLFIRTHPPRLGALHRAVCRFHHLQQEPNTFKQT